MAAQMVTDDSGLRRLFEKPMPENPTLLEALSAWNHHRGVGVHPNNTPVVDTASFTELFGELHFQEKPEQRRAVLPPPPVVAPSSATSSLAEEVDKSKDDASLDALVRPKPAASSGAGVIKRSASFCGAKKRSSASALLMCTEGLGSESTVDADDMLKDDGDAEEAAAAIINGHSVNDKEAEQQALAEVKASGELEKKPPASFPPPIRSFGRGGKPGACFRSFRADGRFVLMEVVTPGKEHLHAYRDGGRLRLQFAAEAAAGGVGVDEEVHGVENSHDENEITAETMA